jgi:hypothetical protein
MVRWLILITWGQRSFYHQGCLAPNLSCGGAFLFAAKAFHVACLYLKMKCLMHEMCSHVNLCLIYATLGAKLLHDVHQREVSYLEEDTWLGGLDMT